MLYNFDAVRACGTQLGCRYRVFVPLLDKPKPFALLKGFFDFSSFDNRYPIQVNRLCLNVCYHEIKGFVRSEPRPLRIQRLKFRAGC